MAQLHKLKLCKQRNSSKLLLPCSPQTSFIYPFLLDFSYYVFLHLFVCITSLSYFFLSLLCSSFYLPFLYFLYTSALFHSQVIPSILSVVLLFFFKLLFALYYAILTPSLYISMLFLHFSLSLFLSFSISPDSLLSHSLSTIHRTRFLLYMPISNFCNCHSTFVFALLLRYLFNFINKLKVSWCSVSAFYIPF